MALAMLVNLRIGLSHYFPFAVSLTLEAKVSLKRIQVILLYIFKNALIHNKDFLLYFAIKRNFYCWMNLLKMKMMEQKGEQVAPSLQMG